MANNIRAKIPNTSVNPNSKIDHLYVKSILTSLETKTSLDIDDLNTKVLKKLLNTFPYP